MIVKVTITEEHIKGATMNALPSELLIISAALLDFAKNEDRNLQDRANAEKMRKDIHFALNESPETGICYNCKHLKIYNGELAEYVCDRKGSVVEDPRRRECDEMWERREP